jgi:hypothetical protein
MRKILHGVFILCVVVISYAGCTHRLERISDGGTVICNSYWGSRALDVEKNTDKPFEYGGAFDGKSFWYLVPSVNVVEAFSPHSGVIDRVALPDTLSHAFVVNLDIHGELFLKTHDDGIYTLDIMSGKIEKLLDDRILNDGSRSIEPDLVTLPDTSLVAFATYNEKNFESDVWLFDRTTRQMKNITADLRQEPGGGKDIHFWHLQFAPATNALLFGEFTFHRTPEGTKKEIRRVWSYDVKKGTITKALLGQREEFEVLQGNYVAPDGKRVLLAMGDCCIWDLSTGIIAEIPHVAGAGKWAIWSPSGRYITYTGSLRGEFPTAEPAWDVYVAEVNSGATRRIRNEGGSDGPLAWYAPPVSAREINLNYLKWLLSLLDRGVESDKAVKRLQEITGQNIGPSYKYWQQWLTENEPFLSWSEKDQKFTLLADAKNSNIAAEVLEMIPEAKRAEWGTLKNDERASLRAEAEKQLAAQRDLEKTAWKAGVTQEIWVRIPEDKQRNWATLKPEERIELVAQAKRKILEQAKPQ